MTKETHGEDMRYPEYHISTKRLKVWAAGAKTHEEKKVYTSLMRKPQTSRNSGKAK